MAVERRLTVKVDPATFQAIKIRCALEGRYLGDLVASVLDKEFIEKSRKRPAVKPAQVAEKAA